MKNNLLLRILTALIGAPLVIGMLFYSPYTLIFFFFLLNIFTLWEFYRLCSYITNNEPTHFTFERVLGTAVGSFIYMSIMLSWLDVLPWKWGALSIPLVFTYFIKELYVPAKSPFTRIAHSILSYVYVTFPYVLAVIIACPDEEFHPLRIIGIFLLLWINDSGAYFGGRFLGQKPLFPRVSPKKTWEGAIIGGLFTLTASHLLWRFFGEFEPLQWFGIGIIVVFFGNWGDLVESLLKRSIQIKDSGEILPGHGGFLDRFDAFLLSIPFIYSFIIISSH